MVRLPHCFVMIMMACAVLTCAACASSSSSTSAAQEKQFVSMWDALYQRLQPEIANWNITLERGHLPLSGDQTTDETGKLQREKGLSSSTSTTRNANLAKTDAVKPLSPSTAASTEPTAQQEASSPYIHIRLADRVLFDSGDDRIKTEGVDVLVRLGHILKEESLLSIVIQGHTDNVPIRERLRQKFSDNLALSRARAMNASTTLQSIGPFQSLPRLEWFGDTRPIADNTTEEGRRKNRRVEILITPQTP